MWARTTATPPARAALFRSSTRLETITTLLISLNARFAAKSGSRRQCCSHSRHVIGLLGELPALSRDGRAKGTRERVVPGGRYVIVSEICGKRRALVVTGIVHAARNR